MFVFAFEKTLFEWFYHNTRRYKSYKQKKACLELWGKKRVEIERKKMWWVGERLWLFAWKKNVKNVFHYWNLCTIYRNHSICWVEVIGSILWDIWYFSSSYNKKKTWIAVKKITATWKRFERKTNLSHFWTNKWEYWWNHLKKFFFDSKKKASRIYSRQNFLPPLLRSFFLPLGRRKKKFDKKNVKLSLENLEKYLTYHNGWDLKIFMRTKICLFTRTSIL